MALFRESVGGAWNPSLLAAHSDTLCHAAYEAHLAFMRRFRGDHPLTAARTELRGHNLACYCRPEDACHSSILLELANEDT